MFRIGINLLFIFFVWIFHPSIHARVLSQEKLDTHLRWNLSAVKDQLVVSKTKNKVKIETINLQVFEEFINELAVLNLENDYFLKISHSKEGFPAKPASVEIDLKNQTVELFSFYREADKKYILDFWINNDLAEEKPVVLSKPLPLPKKIDVLKKDLEKKSDDSSTKVVEKLVQKTNLPIIQINKEDYKEEAEKNLTRDYRYGASFLWDYEPLIPTLEKDINITSKLPDYLYPIKDRENIDDPKEAHIQLSINFYREEKWGFLNKSISLYENKYGRDANLVINEYLKANSILRTLQTKPNRGLHQSALNILLNVKDLTDDYELKSSILRYVLQYYLNQKDFVKSLDLAKQLFVAARAEFDQNAVIQATQTMFNCLSELKQIDKIEEMLSDKKLFSILPPQIGLAYKSYAMVAKGHTKQLIKEFTSIQKSLVKPIHPAILFNVAESYFRESMLEDSLKLYDEFISTYSYLINSPYARLRMAQIYELMDKDIDQTLAMYRNAIDRSTSPEIRFEAKIRYVALRVVRNLRPQNEDFETEIFLEQSPDETKSLNQYLKKILWLTRLRIFIVKKEYDKALTYLASLPMESFSPPDKRVFEGDGAEIIFGLIQASYLKEDYAKVVKIWEVYKDKYETKVAKNAYMNYVVCDSFLKLGLYKSFDRAFSGLLKAKKVEERSFPIWIERVRGSEFESLIAELEISRLMLNKDWKNVRDKLASVPVSYRDTLVFAFQKGLLEFHEKNYANAIPEFEKVFTEKGLKNRLSPRQIADLLMSYVDSLYQLRDQEKFKTVVKAMVSDIDQSKSAQILNVSERIKYLLIETYAGEGNNWSEVEILSKQFNEKFQKSPYSMRIRYLYGLSLIKNLKTAEGKDILKSLTKDNRVPSHIKEMCRSELTSLELKEKNI